MWNALLFYGRSTFIILRFARCARSDCFQALFDELIAQGPTAMPVIRLALEKMLTDDVPQQVK